MVKTSTFIVFRGELPIISIYRRYTLPLLYYCYTRIVFPDRALSLTFSISIEPRLLCIGNSKILLTVGHVPRRLKSNGAVITSCSYSGVQSAPQQVYFMTFRILLWCMASSLLLLQISCIAREPGTSRKAHGQRVVDRPRMVSSRPVPAPLPKVKPIKTLADEMTVLFSRFRPTSWSMRAPGIFTPFL